MIISKEEGYILDAIHGSPIYKKIIIVPEYRLRELIGQWFIDITTIDDISKFNPELVEMYNHNDNFIETSYQLRRIIRERISENLTINKIDIFNILYRSFRGGVNRYTKHYTDPVLWSMVLNDWFLKEGAKLEPVRNTK